MVELSLQGVGYTLIIVGILLFILEASAPGFFIAVPATILLIVGVFALLSPDFSIFTAWAPLVVILVGVPATFATIFIYRRIAPPDAEPTTQTATNLVGLEGVVTAEVKPNSTRGKVKLQNASWSATTREPSHIEPHTHVVVVDVDGVILVVKPIRKE